MTPVTQTILTGPTENSLAACVATLFECPLHQVPNFTAISSACISGRQLDGFDRLGGFVQDHGFRPFWLSHSQDTAQYAVLQLTEGDTAVIHTRGPDGLSHAVIAEPLSLEVVHDPRPNGLAEGHVLSPDEILGMTFFVALK